MEVVVRPTQTLSPCHAGTKQFHVGIGVHEVLHAVAIVSVAAITIVTIAIHVVVHVILIGRVVVVARHVALLRVEGTHGELDGSLTAKPSCRVRGVVRLVVAGVGLRSDGEHLTITDRHDTTVFLVLVKQVGHGEVIQFQSYTSNDTRLTPTQRELHLVV